MCRGPDYHKHRDRHRDHQERHRHRPLDIADAQFEMHAHREHFGLLASRSREDENWTEFAE